MSEQGMVVVPLRFRVSRVFFHPGLFVVPVRDSCEWWNVAWLSGLLEAALHTFSIALQ